MRHLTLSLCRAAIVTAAVATAGTAFAESRLFSVRTGSPGVTIVQAVRNGQQLAVAGQGGGATFFRIDNPSGAVPCANRIVFTASNGRSVDTSADLCASNWELVISVVAGGGGGGSVPATTGRPIIISTDDASVSITGVFLAGKPVTITGRLGSYVRINTPSGLAGFECQRDLGLALSDGRRIARLVDVCQSNFVVIVALVGGPRPPLPPLSFLQGQQSPVIQPLPKPQPQPQPLPQPPPVPTAPEIVANMVWLFSASSGSASFAYGLPNTDASEFTAVCAARSSRTTVTLTRSSPAVVAGARVIVRFTAGSFAKTYTATGSEVSELDGQSHPVLQIPTGDPLWPALIKESVLLIAIGQQPPYGLSLKGSAAKAKQFLAICNPAPPPLVPAPIQPPVLQPAPLQPAPLQPMPGPSANAVGFFCDDGSFISVSFARDSAVVSEPGAIPVVLLRTPSAGGARYVGGLSELIGFEDEIIWTRDGGFTRTCNPN